MAQAKSLFSVNFAVEVDVTGQVNAELAGGRYLGAVGGQVDFVRGAQYSQGGRSIIALPSTTPNGKTSRIAAIAHPDFRDELLACQSASTTPPSRQQQQSFGRPGLA